MRLFTAIDLPREVAARLAALIAELKPAARLKWSPPENLHITLRFIGEWDRERLPALREALAGIAPAGAIPIAVRGLGFFPNARAARVFWTGIEAPPTLAALARATDQALAPLGLEPEKRAFSPHLTLARIRDPMPLDALHARIARLPSLDFGAFTAASFHLYESRLQPSGSVYTKVSEFPLIL